MRVRKYEHASKSRPELRKRGDDSRERIGIVRSCARTSPLLKEHVEDFASQLVTAGLPIAEVQQWMGHSTIAMRMRYAHLAPGSGAGHIQALESARPEQVHGNLTATRAG
jgi:hypothetical protein